MAVDVEHPNPTLAPCPFCGNPQPAPRQLGPAHDRIDGGWCIACDALDCGQTSEAYGTLDVAIARWNRRAPISAPARTVPLLASMPPEWTAAGLGRLQATLDDPKIEARILKDDGAPDPVDDAEREGYLREAQLQGYRAEFFVETINHLIDLAALERLKIYDVHRERHLAQAREACAALAAPMTPPVDDPPDGRDVVAQGSINEPTIDEIGRIMRVLQDAIDQEAQVIVAEKPDAPPMLMKPGAIWPRQWNAAARAVFKHVAEIWGWTVPTDYPRVCPVCGWTRTGLRNYGTPDAPRWLCHGCAARALAANAAKLDDPRFYGPNVTCPICDPHEPGLRERATQHHPSCSLGLALSGKPIPEDGVIRQPKSSP